MTTVDLLNSHRKWVKKKNEIEDPHEFLTEDLDEMINFFEREMLRVVEQDRKFIESINLLQINEQWVSKKNNP